MVSINKFQCLLTKKKKYAWIKGIKKGYINLKNEIRSEKPEYPNFWMDSENTCAYMKELVLSNFYSNNSVMKLIVSAICQIEWLRYSANFSKLIVFVPLQSI